MSNSTVYTHKYTSLQSALTYTITINRDGWIDSFHINFILACIIWLKIGLGHETDGQDQDGQFLRSRHWKFLWRRDWDEMLVHLEMVSWTRCRHQNHNPDKRGN